MAWYRERKDGKKESEGKWVRCRGYGSGEHLHVVKMRVMNSEMSGRR